MELDNSLFFYKTGASVQFIFKILTRIIQQEGTEIGINDLCFIWSDRGLSETQNLPALYNLYRDQKLPKQISVIGLGRRQVSHEDFQERIKESIETFSRHREEGTPELEGF